ncbi:PREDICTED: heterogeneous nuclear ribonucleoprotein H3 isoform X1 [Fragaria vesca subsp. vesca]|uniref:heterogeneous nuclear ribonucleoprotein H3 isoform X1 n=1 Tax=Fragaria vesca subsp. vesca TaxID=101020 RepID=UPI0002C317CD|nr:PREDICTED: heterogeneous nuclear ribonucleoprotein H3 isoform X1 [Fragaria vesca subsp. vesca]
MYGSRGAMLGGGGLSDVYEVGSKRPRMMESNPYFAVGSSVSRGFQPFGGFGAGYQLPAFPVVRLRGLPFNCADIDIFKFFAGLDIVDVLLVNKGGRFSGEAFVVFAGPVQVELALQRDRQNMGRRYVEVFTCKRQDYYNAVAAEVSYEGGSYDNEYQGSPPPAKSSKRFSDKEKMEYTEILKLRGLPFSVKRSQIVDFFKGFKVIEDRVHIACRPDGKATGEAYVEFVSAEEAKRAMSKDKMMIGSRYVELFPSTPDEARRAENRSRQ